MKYAIAFLAISLSLAFAAACSAQWSTTVMADHQSQYILANGQSGYAKPVIQADLFLAHSSGIYVEPWLSLPYDGSNSYGQEVDLFLGYARENVDVGVAYFLIKPVAGIAGDVWYPYIKLSPLDLNLGSLRGKIWTEVDYVGSMDHPSNNGFWLQGYAKYSWLEGTGLPFTHSATIGGLYDTGIFKRDAALIAKYQGDLRWNLGRGITLRAPNVKVVLPVNDSDVESDVSIGAGLTYVIGQ